MDACSPVSPVLFALLLQAAGMGAAEESPVQGLTRRVGETETLALEGLPRSSISNLLWRTASRGSLHIMALWKLGDPLSVLSENYTGRVTFHEESRSLEIHNLSKADGGLYEAVEFQEPDEVVLKKYSLFVFDITTKANLWVNGTCSLQLVCEVGAGANTEVKYSWTPTQPGGGPGGLGSALQLTLHPADKDKSYTCTARALGTELSSSVVPYQSCDSGSWAAGFPQPGWLAGATARAVLGPALLLVLRLL